MPKLFKATTQLLSYRKLQRVPAQWWKTTLQMQISSTLFVMLTTFSGSSLSHIIRYGYLWRDTPICASGTLIRGHRYRSTASALTVPTPALCYIHTVGKHCTRNYSKSERESDWWTGNCNLRVQLGYVCMYAAYSYHVSNLFRGNTIFYVCQHEYTNIKRQRYK